MNKINLVGLLLNVVGIIIIVSGSPIGILLIIFGILLQLKGRGIIDNVFYKAPPNLIRECKVLRTCIVSYWGILGLTMLVSSFEEAGLPNEIINFNDAQFTSIPVLIVGATMLFMIINLLGSIGIFFLQQWGKNVYVAGVLGVVICTPFSGAMVVTPIFGTLDGVLSALSGICLYLLYWSPAKDYFNQKKVSNA